MIRSEMSEMEFQAERGHTHRSQVGKDPRDGKESRGTGYPVAWYSV